MYIDVNVLKGCNIFPESDSEGFYFSELGGLGGGTEHEIRETSARHPGDIRETSGREPALWELDRGIAPEGIPKGILKLTSLLL